MHSLQATDKLQMFENRLVKVFRHTSKQAKRQHITCFRIYDHDLPEFPLCIELYEDKLYIAEYRRHHGMTDEAHEAWLDAALLVVEKVVGIPQENIYIKQRQRKQGRLGQYQKVNEEKQFFMVHEGGLQFLVNLSDYLDTGLFLDHRATRTMVREEANNRRVLNLFAYTGSFSVYAAAGGAAAVTTVDLSKTYLTWAEENMKLNGFSGNQFLFVNADVKQYLQELKPRTFDLVIMDPPTFSNSKKMKDDFLDIQRDHAEMINAVYHTLSPGGILYFSTNFSRFLLEKEKLRFDNIKDVTNVTTPFDFAGKLKRYCWKMVK
ncbi:MAG: class I SAM-dependent methyltransferase [Sphingobacteriales bacterium]|nr:class I SAM-dependent methyltransferase [Sphingobacteriales bacterium]